MQDILSRLPPGFKFHPTGEELISYYLHRKVHGLLTPEEADLIKVCNLYGEGAQPSCEIFKKFTGHKEGGDALYFFTTLSKKAPNSTQRMRRTDGNGGTWHGDNVEEVICRECNGTRRRFRYQNKQRPDQDGCWTLLEYGSESISKNVAVCELKESRKRKRMDPVEKPAHHQEPRPLIQNQEMLPLVGTVSNEYDGGFSATGDTFYSIQNMEAPAKGNIEPVLPIQPQQANFILEYGSESISKNVAVCELKESRKRKRMDPVEKPAHHQEPRPLIQNQEMLPLVGTVSNEYDGGFSATGDTFYSIQNMEAPAKGNIEPVLPIQPQQANFILEYGSESISKNVAVCELKESRKRKRMDPVEKPAHHQEPRPLIQNQEMLPLVGTVSNEYDGGFSATGDTFYSIQNMEAPAKGNIELVLPIQPQQANFILEYGSESISKNVAVCELKESRKRKRMDPVEKPAHHQEPRPLIQNQEMLPLVGTVSNEYDGGFSATGDTFYSIQNMEAPAKGNIEPVLPIQPQQANFIQEPMISEHQQMAFASFSDNQKVVLHSGAVFDGYHESQEMLPLVGTVSNEDYGGFPATGDTSYSIQNMVLEAPAMGNIEPVFPIQPQQANFIQEPMISEHQQMAFASFSDNQKVLQSEPVFDGHERSQNIVESIYEHPTISFEPIMPLAEESIIIENEEIIRLATFSTENYFENAAAIVNIEPTTANENQQMVLASYINGDEGVCPAGDNAVTPEAAAPAVSAIPVMDAGLIKYLKNETNWSANFEALSDSTRLWS